jgi:hypothetical protein
MADYVVTGTITTNGTIGSLDPSDIISWSIYVDGPRPYTFHPGNPGARVDPSDVFASLTTLETSGHFGWLWFFANENTLPNCSDCRQQLGWTSWPSGEVYYNYYDGDGEPFFAPAIADLDTVLRAPIAVRVPEPPGFITAFLSVAILAIVWRQKKGTGRKLAEENFLPF